MNILHDSNSDFHKVSTSQLVYIIIAPVHLLYTSTILRLRGLLKKKKPKLERPNAEGLLKHISDAPRFATLELVRPNIAVPNSTNHDAS